LSRTQRIGPVNFEQLMKRFGSATRALAELPHIVKRTGGSLTPYPLDKLHAELARAEAAGARLIVRGDKDYPDLLKQIDTAPPVLWTLGPLKPRRKAVAGARNASAAGQKISGAQTFIGLAALSELEITGRLTAGDGGFYSRP
jgi:DNA processing protein